jgi:hypothetical protein
MFKRIIQGLENGSRGSRFPNLIHYLEMEGEDIDYEQAFAWF